MGTPTNALKNQSLWGEVSLKIRCYGGTHGLRNNECPWVIVKYISSMLMGTHRVCWSEHTMTYLWVSVCTIISCNRYTHGLCINAYLWAMHSLYDIRLMRCPWGTPYACAMVTLQGDTSKRYGGNNTPHGSLINVYLWGIIYSHITRYMYYPWGIASARTVAYPQGNAFTVIQWNLLHPWGSHNHLPMGIGTRYVVTNHGYPWVMCKCIYGYAYLIPYGQCFLYMISIIQSAHGSST